ncbi:MAG: SpoIIE family protein phosphatase [Candidatus Sericytochromatia bacterium]|nr:SpoIIE family protein phosphatase [Candidatus Sericytochromatia bacterium]
MTRDGEASGAIHRRLLGRLGLLVCACVFFALWGSVLLRLVAGIGEPDAGFRVNRVATVWITNEPYTRGVRAGLRPGDQVVAVQGVPIPDGPDFLRQVSSLGNQKSARYTVLRGDQTLQFEVAVVPLGGLDCLGIYGVRAFLALAMAVMGLAAAWLRPDNPAARANLVFCLGWACYALLDIDFERTYTWHPLWYYASVFLYASGALSLALNFPQPLQVRESRARLQVLPYGLAAALFLWVAGAFWQGGIGLAAVELAEQIGTIWANGVLAIGLALFLWRLRHASVGRERAQLQVLLLGVALAYLPYALLVNLPLLLTGQPPAPAILLGASSLFALFPLSVSYAIAKHGLFDIEIIVKRTTTYALVTSALFGGYFALAAGVRWLALRLGLQGSDWENALVTAVIVVLFVPVRDALARMVDRLFFRVPYDFRAVVARVHALSRETLDLDVLKSDFLNILDAALAPRYSYILTREAAGDMLVAQGPAAVRGQAPFAELLVHVGDELLQRAGLHRDFSYVPGSGKTSPTSMLAALGPHERIPLLVGDEVVGLVVLGPRRSDKEYASEDRDLLAAIRLPLAAAIKTASLVEDRLFKERVAQDLRRAREVQQAMLPAELPDVPGYGFAARSEACYEASGDYYDCLALPDGRVALAIADVAGKGFAAALATAMLKSCLLNQTQQDPGVMPTLSALNRLLVSVTAHASVKSFTSCAYALLEPSSGLVQFACAGHFPPLHWQARTGRVLEPAISGSFPLGVRSSLTCTSHALHLEPGDALVFYTDGITEATAPSSHHSGELEFYEVERVKTVVATHGGESASSLLEAIYRDVRAFTAGDALSDDMTLLVVKWHGAEANGLAERS